MGWDPRIVVRQQTGNSARGRGKQRLSSVTSGTHQWMPHSGQKGSLCDCGGGGPQALLQAPHIDGLLLVMWGLTPPPILSGPRRALGSGDRPSYDPASGLEKRSSYPSFGSSCGGGVDFSIASPEILPCSANTSPEAPLLTTLSAPESCAGQNRMCPETEQQAPPDQWAPSSTPFKSSCCLTDVLGRVHCASPIRHLPQSSVLSTTSDKVSQTGHVQNSRSPQEMELGGV